MLTERENLLRIEKMTRALIGAQMVLWNLKGQKFPSPCQEALITAALEDIADALKTPKENTECSNMP